MIITIVLTVYGDSPWLDKAVQSVLDQKSGNWKLLIADDGADKKAYTWLKSKLDGLQDQRIKWVRRPKNLGLFANLNEAIEAANTEWILLLCSDDVLHKNAITSLQKLNLKWPEVDLILSSFESINSNGSLRRPDSSQHHDQLRVNTGLVQPSQMIPQLLRIGSLNGNLTGMAFSKKHWRNVGPFREDWRHAADWEWLIRASETKPLLLNRSPIASVRTHDQQLSVSNRKSGHECQEVAAVVSMLLKHPILRDEPRKGKWASHVMQFQLWNLLKSAIRGDWGRWQAGMKAIHESSGLRQSSLSLLLWLPERCKRAMKLSAR